MKPDTIHIQPTHQFQPKKVTRCICGEWEQHPAHEKMPPGWPEYHASLKAQQAAESLVRDLAELLKLYRSGHAFCVADPKERDESIFDHAPCEWCEEYAALESRIPKELLP